MHHLTDLPPFSLILNFGRLVVETADHLKLEIESIFALQNQTQIAQKQLNENVTNKNSTNLMKPISDLPASNKCYKVTIVGLGILFYANKRKNDLDSNFAIRNLIQLTPTKTSQGSLKRLELKMELDFRETQYVKLSSELMDEDAAIHDLLDRIEITNSDVEYLKEKIFSLHKFDTSFHLNLCRFEEILDTDYSYPILQEAHLLFLKSEKSPVKAKKANKAKAQDDFFSPLSQKYKIKINARKTQIRNIRQDLKEGKTIINNLVKLAEQNDDDVSFLTLTLNRYKEQMPEITISIEKADIQRRRNARKSQPASMKSYSPDSIDKRIEQRQQRRVDRNKPNSISFDQENFNISLKNEKAQKATVEKRPTGKPLSQIN